LPPNTKKETVPKDKGYRYPMIKGVTDMVSNKKRKSNTIGGKKTKRKQRKTRKHKRYSRRRH
jgi:hypothetical protein